MHRAFFVAAVDVTDSIPRGVGGERDMRPVYDAEHHLDALGLQTFCQQFSNSYFGHVVSFYFCTATFTLPCMNKVNLVLLYGNVHIALTR